MGRGEIALIVASLCFSATARAYDTQFDSALASRVSEAKLRDSLRVEFVGLTIESCSFRKDAEGDGVLVRVVVGGVARERSVDLSDLEEGAERVLALVAHTLAVAPPVAIPIAPAPRPADVPPPPPSLVPAPAAAIERRAEWHVSPLFGANATSTFSGGPIVGEVFGGLSLFESRSRLGVEFDGGYQFATRERNLGVLTLDGITISASPYYRVGRPAGVLGVDVGPRLGLSYVWISGDASPNVQSNGVNQALLQLSVQGTLRYSLRGPFTLLVGGELGGYLKGLRVRGDGSDIASFDGLFIGVRAGVAF